jgi:histidine triad (HIT) family protein
MEEKEFQNCLFCKIIKGIEASYIFYEDEKHIAFLSIFPNTKGFTVLATKNHYESYAFAQSDEVLQDLIIASKNVAKIIDNAFEDVGRTGFILEGFGINHLHAKFFPMHGTSKNNWTPIKSNQKKFFDFYEGYISSNDSYLADEIELQNNYKLLTHSSKKLGY